MQQKLFITWENLIIEYGGWNGFNTPYARKGKGEKTVRNFVREKKIYCGKKYLEVDIYPYTENQKEVSRRGKRAKKEKVSEPKQKN